MGKTKKILLAFSHSSRRIALGMSILKLLRSVMSITAIILSAYYFGTSIKRDSWVIITSIVGIVISAFFGPLNETLRVKFIHIREEQGEDIAAKSIQSLLSFVFWLIILLIFIFELFPRNFCRVFAPGFDENQLGILTTYFKFYIPCLVLNELTIIWLSVLNAYNTFYLPEIIGFITLIFQIAFIIVLSPIIGIYSLMVSSYFSFFLLAICYYTSVKKINFKFTKITTLKFKLIKPYIVFSFPFYIPYIIGQCYLYTEKSLCTIIGEGSVSILDYARKFIDIPMGVIFAVVPTILAPSLTYLYTKNLMENFNHEVRRFLRMVIFAIVPISTACFFCSKQIIEILIKHGAFDARMVDETATILKWFSIGLIGVTLYIIAGQALVSIKKNISYVIAGSLVQSLNILFCILSYKIFGIKTFAIFWSITHLASGLVMLFYLFRKDKKAKYEVVQIIFMVIFIFGVVDLFTTFLPVTILCSAYPIVSNVLCVIFTVIVTVILLLISLFALKFEERELVYKLIKRRQ